jgi:SAM-dependent methyltransferase
MDLARFTPFRGVGGYGPDARQTAETLPERRFAQAFTERPGAVRFYRYFPELPGALAGQRVLDFGCGYGGKALAYAEHAAFVAGVEPHAHVIALCEGYRQAMGATNVQFRTCTQARIPYPAKSFDVVVSHDVLEHVDNPAISLAEIARVLRPGGTAYLAFPPYDGALSHHLDYACRLPALHWLFSPETLVAAANLAIAAWNIQGVSQQPAPQASWDGGRRVLPLLNGLTSAQFDRLSRRHFASRRVRYLRIPTPRNLRRAAAGVVGVVLYPIGLLGSGARDRVTYSIIAKLTKAS